MSNAFRAGGNGWSDDFLREANVFLAGAVPADPQARNRLLNYRRDTEIPKHRMRWNWVVDLPFGRGQRFVSNAGGALNRLIGGWQIAGNMRSYYFALPTGNWGQLGPIEIYGTKYPIEDCRSGRCIPGYLWYNGYIPAHRINSVDPQGRPNGVMGVPSNYRPSSQPVNPTPASGGTSPLYETNDVTVRLRDGSTPRVAVNTELHPWQNQVAVGPRRWGLDASLFKSIPITERFTLRFNADFFNVLNMPGLELPNSTSGILSLQNSAGGARQLQLTLRLTW